MRGGERDLDELEDQVGAEDLDGEDFDSTMPEDVIEEGLLKLLSTESDFNCHAIASRLSECLPFLKQAREATSGRTLAGALEHLENIIRGEG